MVDIDELFKKLRFGELTGFMREDIKKLYELYEKTRPLKGSGLTDSEMNEVERILKKYNIRFEKRKSLRKCSACGINGVQEYIDVPYSYVFSGSYHGPDIGLYKVIITLTPKGLEKLWEKIKPTLEFNKEILDLFVKYREKNCLVDLIEICEKCAKRSPDVLYESSERMKWLSEMVGRENISVKVVEVKEVSMSVLGSEIEVTYKDDEGYKYFGELLGEINFPIFPDINKRRTFKVL